MIRKQLILLAAAALLSPSFLFAEKPSFGALLDAALARDVHLEILDSEGKVLELQHRLEDTGEGFLFGLGTGAGGVRLTHGGNPRPG